MTEILISKHNWEYIIAEKLEVGIEGQNPEQFISAMAASLRKAKADGLREYADDLLPKGGVHAYSAISHVCNDLRNRADKIERGEND